MEEEFKSYIKEGIRQLDVEGFDKIKVHKCVASAFKEFYESKKTLGV